MPVRRVIDPNVFIGACLGTGPGPATRVIAACLRGQTLPPVGTALLAEYEDMATVMLAEFDAETRFELRVARGSGRTERGLGLLEKAAGPAAD